MCETLSRILFAVFPLNAGVTGPYFWWNSIFLCSICSDSNQQWIHLLTSTVCVSQPNIYYSSVPQSSIVTGWHVPSSPWTHTLVYFDSVPHTSSCRPKYSLEHQIWIHSTENSPQQMNPPVCLIKTTVSSCFKLLRLFKHETKYLCF